MMWQSRTYTDAPSVDSIDINRAGRRLFSLGVLMMVLAFLGLGYALYIVWFEKTHEERTYVLMEVDMMHGVIRPIQEFDGTLPPEWRMRLVDSTMVELVSNLETFNRAMVNANLTHASNFMARNTLEPFLERARGRVKEFLAGDSVEVEVHNISPITGFVMDDPKARHQVLVDFEVVERKNGMQTSTLWTATITYRFLGYTREQLESVDKEQVQQIRVNPMGVKIEGYVRKQSTLPPSQPAITVQEQKKHE